MLDQKISDLSVGSLGASDYTIIQRGTDNYRFLIRDAIDARIYSLAALSGHGHTIATSSVSGFMSAADKIKLDSIASGATSSGASGDAYAVSHESDTTAHTAANIVNVPAGNISAITVQAALNELDTEKQPLDALLTALSALTTTADKFIYFTGSDTPATSTVTAFARTFLDDTSGSGVLATLSGISREELSYGGVGVADYNKIPKYNIDGSLAVSNKISIFNPDDTRFVNVKYLSNIGDYNLFIPGTVAEDDAYFVVVPATAQVGDIVYWGGTGVGGIATNGTSGYVLISNGAGSPPTWGQVTGGGGSGVSDGDKGDITVSSAGAVWTIDSGINAAKIADGSVSNTEFQYLDGVTSNIQTQLGNKQPLDATLTALAALTTAANTFIYFTGADSPVTGSVTSAARSVLDDATTDDILVTLGGAATEGTGGIVRRLAPTLVNPSVSGAIVLYKAEIAPTNTGAGVIWVEDASPTKLVYKDSTETDDYVVLLTKSQSLTNKVINGVTLETGGSTSEFLNRFGTYSTPAGGGSGTLTDGDKGDITVTSSGSVWTIDSGLSATKIADGSVSNTEFQYLDGVTSNIQTQLGNKQPLDATLTALAAYNTNGVLVQTSADTFVGRTITGTSDEITVTNGDGVGGNPTLSLPTGINPTKLADGSVSATEFQYLDGVTSNIQTQFSNKQPLDATLTALASYNTNGLLAQTAADTFAGRTVTAGQGISVSNGDGVAGNPTIALNTNALRGEISFRIDGGGSAITTGAKKIYLRVGYDCTITGWELVADQSGSIAIDIWKDSFAHFPPTLADTITASAKPSLSSAQTNSSSSLTGWTTSVSAGDYLEINVDSASTVTLAILTLLVTRT